MSPFNRKKPEPPKETPAPKAFYTKEAIEHALSVVMDAAHLGQFGSLRHVPTGAILTLIHPADIGIATHMHYNGHPLVDFLDKTRINTPEEMREKIAAEKRKRLEGLKTQHAQTLAEIEKLARELGEGTC